MTTENKKFFSQVKMKSCLVVFTLLLIGCAPKQFGYKIHQFKDQPAKNFALIVHAVNDFPVKIFSFDGRNIKNTIKTKTHIPTYLEVMPGKHQLGLGLTKGFGDCGRVVITSKNAYLLDIEVEAGKVYLIQRRSKFDAKTLCQDKGTIHVEYFLSELPSLPYDDVRSEFLHIDLTDHTSL